MQIWETDSQEAENKRKALIITILVNVLLLIAIYFIVVWKEQIPPLPTYGMELNLGFTDQGSGNNQTTTPSAETATNNTESPAPGEVAAKPVESSVPVSEPKTQAAKPKSSPAKTTYEAQSQTPSPIKGSEKSSTASKEPSPAKKDPTPITQPSTSEAEKTTTKAEEKPKVDQRAIFGAGGTSGTSAKTAKGSAQGSSNQKGDEGKPTGTVDGRAIMGSGTGEGNSGPASGVGLELAGWDFASRPTINDNVSTRNGKIVFKITVDDSGKIVQAVPLEYNVSNEVLAYYRTVVNKVNFKRQSGNPTADYSTGKITFIIKVD
ncbi:energy transducer TonB [Aquiflexum gelatinilyticum]|uniref:energy transducer TonB n=1 Tax=Aquiflexum gelatinilyticum TaxID=2961943 RepID=UPI00216767F5|nr:energy transducer TonB [Aquiflexum gelatinilyticum]MCS4432975.1 energy transducer TonB [Aquiflexum gelatinilyticum]